VCGVLCVGLRRQFCRFAALAGLLLLSWLLSSFVAGLFCVGVFCAAAVCVVCFLLGIPVVGLPGRFRPVAVPYLGRRRLWAAWGAGSGFPVFSAVVAELPWCGLVFCCVGSRRWFRAVVGPPGSLPLG
jgi:hypothetical protein